MKACCFAPTANDAKGSKRGGDHVHDRTAMVAPLVCAERWPDLPPSSHAYVRTYGSSAALTMHDEIMTKHQNVGDLSRPIWLSFDLNKVYL